MSSDLKQLNKFKKNSRRTNNVVEPKIVERLIKISRVSKVTKGGKQLSFRAIVVVGDERGKVCLLYTSPSPRDATLSRMPSSA